MGPTFTKGSVCHPRKFGIIVESSHTIAEGSTDKTWALGRQAWDEALENIPKQHNPHHQLPVIHSYCAANPV